MVKISKNEDKVIVTCEVNDDFFKNEDNRIFLVDICGFNEVKKFRKYELESDNPNEIIDDLREEWEENTISYGDSVKKVFTQRKHSEKEFLEYKKIGNKLKHQSEKKVKLFGLKKGFRLKSYQNLPVKHMELIPNTANFSIPGAGKTIMTYAGFNILKQQKKIDQLIVIGPLPSFGPWKNEFQICMPGFKNKTNTKIEDERLLKKQLLIYHGTVNQRKELRKKFETKSVIVTTYGTAANDKKKIIAYLKTTKKKVMIVLDESHRIKTIEEVTKKGNDTISASMIEIGAYAKRRSILTGTPMPHEWDDLWSQITFLWPDNKPLGTRANFTSLIEGKNIEKVIKDKIDFTWTRVSNKQVKKDLPTQRWHIVGPPKKPGIAMDKIQAEIYTIIRSQLLSNVPRGRTQDWVKKMRRARVIRLLQTVTNPRLLVAKDPIYSGLAPPIHQERNRENLKILKLLQKYDKENVSNKIKEAAELARKLSDEKKNVVIFTHFRGNVKLLMKILRDKKPIGITGEINDHKMQEERINEFKEWGFRDGTGKILIATAGTVAESVSLHKNKNDKPVCNNAIFLERSYDAGKYMQALHRIYRIGSIKSQPVNYYILMSRYEDGTPTIDNTVNNVLEERLKKLYKLLDDKTYLKAISLDTAVTGKGKKKQRQFYSEGDNEEDIHNKILLEEKKNEKKQKS